MPSGFRPFGVSLSVPVLLACACAPMAAGQWTVVEQVPAEVAALPSFVRSTGVVARIDWLVMDAALAAAPTEGPGVQGSGFTLPLADGSLADFTIVEAALMEDGLAAKFPEMRTYRVRGVSDPAAVGCIDITPHGLRAMVRTAAGTVFIDPYSARQREYVSVYDLARHVPEGGALDWSCHANEEPLAIDHELGLALEDGAALGPGVNIRQYRMAIACTGEFGVFHSALQGHAPNTADALAALVTLNNRASLIFEVDLGVRFVMVSNNDLLAFYDPATDPYPNADPACTVDPAADCSLPYHSANQGVVNGIIGSANYDVGHVMTRVRGGVASLGSICTTNKARGVSGIPRGGEVDPLAATVLLHELGHQFGAGHTFNGVLGRCGGNHTGSSAWEPGGGSTLLSYPGACPVGGPYGTGTTDNLVQFADVYFHSGSLIQMRNFLNSTTSQCSTNVATTNLAPSITTITPTLLTIPPLTPFALEAVISDDSPQPLYCWDELDVGPEQSLVGGGAVDNGLSPLFRSFYPGTSSTRVFPRWVDVLSGTASLGEQRPSLAGSQRKFRITVRDMQGASLTSSLVRVNVGGGSPFAITAPSGGRVDPGSTLNIAWSVGETANSPMSVSTVRVLLSPTGDENFSVVLGEVPNTGSASVALPGALQTPSARVMLEPTNANIFFAVSSPFMILPPCDSIDFNQDGLFPDTTDINDLLSVFAGGPCSTEPPAGLGCSDIDFYNDGLFPDVYDIDVFLLVFAGGACPA